MSLRPQGAVPGHSGADLRVVNIAPEVTVLLPCLDEAPTVAICVQEALSALGACEVSGEVLVVDNGSADGSA